MRYGRQLNHTLAVNRPRPKEQTRRYFYQPLLQVTIHHRYYNGKQGTCADFTLMPTSSCRELMASLALLYKPQHNGFCVMYNEQSSQLLFNYLERQRAADLVSKLCFIGSNTQPYLVNFSMLDFDTNSSKRNFYLNNTQAHLQSPDTLLLTRDTFVTQATEGYFDTVPARFSMTFNDADWIAVVDISGKEVCCYPRWVPAVLLNNSRRVPVTGAMVKKFVAQYQHLQQSSAPSEWVARESVMIDLLPDGMGLYHLRWCKADGSTAGEIIDERSVIYTDDRQNPFFMIDLLLDRPPSQADSAVNAQRGVYPLDWQQQIVTERHYQLNFNRRAVFWLYWVIPRVEHKLFCNLTIIDDATDKSAFHGPFDSGLDGKPAWYFISKQPLALQQTPEYSFTLKGELGEGFSRILSSPLAMPCGLTLLSEFDAELGIKTVKTPEAIALLSTVLAKKYAATYIYL